MNDEREALRYAQTMYDLGYPCPEAGRSHDSAPCCICGKTIMDADLRARLDLEQRDEPRERYSNIDRDAGLRRYGEI